MKHEHLIARIAIVLVAAFFALMGAYGLADPQGVLAIFAPQEFNLEMRNEIRAVYGGFGLAVAGVLLFSLRRSVWTAGVRLAVAVAVLGMAGGRLVSFVLEQPAGNGPVLLLFVEFGLAGLLMLSLWLDRRTA